jgi:thioredoxin reductase (NADPH)
VRAKTVVLATGVESVRPAMSDEDHASALRNGALRYCPICDGFEVIDKNVAVVGDGDRLFGEAKFLRSYTSAVTALSESGTMNLSAQQRAELSMIGVEMIDSPVSGYVFTEGLSVIMNGGVRLRHDVRRARLDHPVALGGELERPHHGGGLLGCRLPSEDKRFRDYAAGDVVVGIDQIGHAVGQATVAATTLRNDLCERSALLRG